MIRCFSVQSVISFCLCSYALDAIWETECSHCSAESLVKKLLLCCFAASELRNSPGTFSVPEETWDKTELNMTMCRVGFDHRGG